MPTFARLIQPLRDADADAIAVFAAKGEDAAVLGADAMALGEVLGVDAAAELAAVNVKGEAGSVGRIPTRGAISAALVMVVGLGPADEVDLEALRRAAGTAARQATKDSTLALAVPVDLLPQGTDGREAIQAAVEGAGLGAYAFTQYRTKTPDSPSLTAVHVHAEGMADDEVEAGIAAGLVVVQATSTVRDLINTPPGAKRPPVLAERIATLARDAGLEVRVLDEADLAEGGFGGILGVGQGSSEPPRLVELTYTPPGEPTSHVALVGKGITFDTGGISLKPSTSMVTMKSDMSGAATVAGALLALGDLGITAKVTGLLAIAENMPSGTAIRVSDVLTHRGGRTTEVMNTDAEGRLVLADALAYAAESEPDVIIDLATLTGAQIVALGPKVAAVMGTDETLVEALCAAAREAGEQIWPLPLHAEYAEHLRSEVADARNIGRQGQAGTIVAGLFLKEFTAGLPWAHLDIAGPAFTEDGDAHYTPKGATGMGLRTLLRYLQAR